MDSLVFIGADSVDRCCLIAITLSYLHSGDGYTMVKEYLSGQ